jgi:hypothetical protein
MRFMRIFYQIINELIDFFLSDHDSECRVRKTIRIGNDSGLNDDIAILGHLHIVPFTFVLTLLINMNHARYKRPFDVTTIIKVVLVQYITRCDQIVNECHLSALVDYLCIIRADWCGE